MCICVCVDIFGEGEMCLWVCGIVTYCSGEVCEHGVCELHTLADF